MRTPSRHLQAIVSRVAAGFICATAEGFSEAVAVTYRHLIVARADRFSRPRLRRYRLQDISALRLRHGLEMSFLRVTLGEPEQAIVVVLFETSAAADFERVASAIQR